MHPARKKVDKVRGRSPQSALSQRTIRLHRSVGLLLSSGERKNERYRDL